MVKTSPAGWPVLKSYTGEHLARLALPVGGIGTGTVSLCGWGSWRHWEVANRPAKGFTPRGQGGAGPFFAVRAARRGRLAPGETVAIIGAGNIGLLTVEVARAMGAEKIIVLEPAAHRRQVGARRGPERAACARGEQGERIAR